MSDRNVSNPHTLSVASLGACAAILAWMGASWLGADTTVSMLCAAVAGGYVSGRVFRAYRERERV